MTRFKIGAAVLGLVIVALGAAAPAGAWERGDVDVLAVLPDVTPGVQSSVEGLTVGPDGNIYVPSFGFNTTRALTGNAVLFVISPSGHLVRQVTIANSTRTCSGSLSIRSPMISWCSTSGPERSSKSTRSPGRPASS
jgi:hypothetical protein